MKMKWNNENIKYAKKLIDKGYTQKEASKKMGVSSSSLNNALYRSRKNTKIKTKELKTSEINMMFRDGISPCLIKQRTGLSLKVIRETAENLGIVNY